MSLLTNITAYYKYDENTGTSVGDSVGSNTGVFSGSGTKWGTGIINSAGNFLKTDTIPESVLLTTSTGTPTDNFTVAGWIKPVIPIQTACVFYDGDDSAGWGLFTGDALDGTGSKLVGLFGSVSWADPSITITNGVWQHVAMIRRSGTLYFYLNAVETSSINNTPNTPTAGIASFGAQIGSGTPKRYYSGLIDEMGIWGRALSAAEVTQLYNSGAGLQYPFTTGTPIRFQHLSLLGIG